jgi:alpha-tubulin suppressor-like RCC1 family protein
MYLAVPSPVRVRANVSISAIDPTGRIAAGDKHTCAIAQNDTIWCWGDNFFSQIGKSSFTDDFSLNPVQTTALPGSRVARRIVAGMNHTCVLATDGTVWCWGDNGWGALGVSGGTQADPVQVTLGKTATKIAAGGAETCALLSDDSLKCWGRNNKGQLGNGTSGSVAVTSPVYTSFIPASFTVAHLEIGSSHSCAVSVTGTAWCWGDFTNGRLGTTGLSNAVTPTATASLGGSATEIAAGAAHTCALLMTGSVSCFGNNNMGQLGQALATASSSTPTVLTFEATATRVSAGGQFTCALLSTAAVHCFGDNASGQLGSGASGSARETPGAVTGLAGTVVDVTTGTSHACAVMSTGQVRCWGLNDQGQLGIGTQTNVATASAISTLNVVPTTTAAPITVAPTTIAPSSSTVVQTTTTSISTTSTSTSSTTSTSTTELTTGTVAMALAAKSKAKVLIHPMAVRRGSNVSAAKLAASVSLSIPKRSVGTMRISITKGKKYCAFVGTSLKAVHTGKCTIVVIYLPRKGRSVLRSNTLTVKA